MWDIIFWTCLSACAAVRTAQYFAEKRSHAAESAEADRGTDGSFSRFQANYLIVFLLAVASDWLQGPYVYALYTMYGYTQAQIGHLFIAGFGSSAVFGTFVASIADKYGRRMIALVFAVTYFLSCLTKHSPVFWVLMVGRILGGIATSILFSVFESWLVCEHNTRGFNPEWLSETFSKAQFGNSVVAILAGQVAGYFAQRFGKVAPFDLSAVVLVVLFGIIALTWTENTGNSKASVSGGFKDAWAACMASRRILLVGLIQSCFEGAMYVFVFIWTPALQKAQDGGVGGEIPHGVIFSTFMVACMIGSSLFTFIVAYVPLTSAMRFVYLLGTSVFLLATYSTNVWVTYSAFVVFELLCGIYFPAMGTIRAKFVPESTRSAIMNFFRIPLNCIVVVLLYNNLTTQVVMTLCAGLLAIATVAQHLLHVAGPEEQGGQVKALGAPPPVPATQDDEKI